ncbi:MAG: hypothetical protein QM599_08255 [Pseudoxanthomonas sp.]
MNQRTAGIVHATLLTTDIAAASAAYVEQLGLQRGRREHLCDADAVRLDLPDLALHPVQWLTNADGLEILRLIEDPAAAPARPMFHHGWMSLEILVGDIDALAARLRPPFQVLGAPANLDFSDAIRAAQVLGPCGELLYLTQVKAPVPPFDLPLTDAEVAFSFIGVTATPSRDASHAAWKTLLDASGWSMETRITVLNRAHGKPLEDRYPIAVVPMPGQCMVEIDQVELADATPAQRCTGLHSLALRLPQAVPARLAQAGWRVVDAGGCGWRGIASEHIELLGEPLQD